CDALDQPGRDPFPFPGRNDARDQVEGKDSFRALGITVDIESNALAQKGQIDRLAFAVEFVALKLGELINELTIMGSDLPCPRNQFVEELAWLVALQQHNSPTMPCASPRSSKRQAQGREFVSWYGCAP